MTLKSITSKTPRLEDSKKHRESVDSRNCQFLRIPQHKGYNCTTFMDLITSALTRKRPLRLEEAPWPVRPRILVLAPHPDDFDAIVVTLRFFRDRGDDISLSVISTSWSGVEDSFCDSPTPAAKAAVREAEQLRSCRLFGLTDDRIQFLRLQEDIAGDPLNDEDNCSAVSSHLASLRPDLIFLPHPNDPNPGHRLVYKMLCRHIAACNHRGAALLNRDPKTLDMRVDILTPFDDETASWKAELLRCHQSQHQRNLNTRGYGFDERILRANRLAAAEFTSGFAYAEVFEHQRFELMERTEGGRLGAV